MKSMTDEDKPTTLFGKLCISIAGARADLRRQGRRRYHMVTETRSGLHRRYNMVTEIRSGNSDRDRVKIYELTEFGTDESDQI